VFSFFSLEMKADCELDRRLFLSFEMKRHGELERHSCRSFGLIHF
jgi:hypothetical protein